MLLSIHFRQPGDDNKMLVCDTCDKGYHTFCLRPVMTTIPKNGWKCKVCVTSSMNYLCSTCVYENDEYTNLFGIIGF